MRSYIKLDCAFYRHPKAVAVGRDGRDLFVASLCYSGDMLTDGFIPVANLSILGVESGVRNVKAAADALVGVGLWEVVDGGFKAHDYRDYNSAAEDVHAKRSAAKSRMQQMRSQDVRANKSRTDEIVRANNSIRSPNVQECSPDVREQEQYVQQEQYSSLEPNGSAELEDGQKPETPVEPKPKPKPVRETRIPDDFSVDDDMTRWAESKGFSYPEIDHHTERFVSYWLAEGGVKAKKLNWRQAWQTWVSRETPGRWPGGARNGSVAIGRDTTVRSGGAAKGGMTPAEILAYGKRRQEELAHESR